MAIDPEQIAAGLTRSQFYLLRYLEHGSRTAEKRQHIGPLRLLEERGLVGRSMLGRWSLTSAGLSALRARQSTEKGE